MRSTILKVCGIGALGGALAVAATIHSPGSGPEAGNQASEGFHRVDRLQNQPSVHRGAVPRQRSLKSRQTDSSIASRLRARKESRIHVGGFVRRPGPIEMVEGLTLWGAIQTAGGVTEFGSHGRVKVTRNGIMTQYDLKLAESKQVAVEAGDVVEVPQKVWLGR